MKWNINMLDHTFGPSLKDEIKCNIDLQSQIKINMAEWKMQSKIKYDLGQFVKEPEHFLSFPNPLPAANKFRTEKLKAELNLVKIFDDIQKKDKLGRNRRNSVDMAKDAKWAKVNKSLEEINEIKIEMIA